MYVYGVSGVYPGVKISKKKGTFWPLNTPLYISNVRSVFRGEGCAFSNIIHINTLYTHYATLNTLIRH